MPRLNLRLLAIVFAAAAGLSAAVYFVHEVQVRRNADFFVREARRARDASQWQEAVRNYPLYLKYYPDDLEAKEEYGECLSKVGLYRRAFETFEQVLRKDPDRSGARLQLVKVAMQVGRYADARQHLERLLVKAPPKDGELLELRGRCEEATGQYEAAKDSYAEAIKSAPQRLGCYARLATLLRRHLRDSEQAEKQADKQMEDLVQKNPDSAEAYLLRGGYRQMVVKLKEEAGQNDEAMTLLKQAAQDADETLRRVEPGAALESDETKRALHRAAALLMAAQCALKRGLLTQDQGGKTDERDTLFKSARGFAQRGVDEIPKYAPFYSILADIDANTGRRDEAIGWLRRGLEAVSEADRADLLWALTNLLIDRRMPEDLQEAAGHLDKLEKELEYQPPLVGYLRGCLQCAQKEWADSARTFERFRPQLRAWPRLEQQADYLLGTCYGLLGSPDQQLTAFRRAATLGGRWTPARQGLISALVSVGRFDEALEQLPNPLREKVPANVSLQYARLSIVRNLQLSETQRNWKEVDGVVDQLAAVAPDLMQVPILRAEAMVARKQFDAAEKLLLEARSRHAQEPDLWLALASLAQRQKNWEAAGQFLAEAEKRFPDRVSVRLARARYLAFRFGDKAAGQLRELAKQVESKEIAEDDFRQWAFGLAILSFQSNDFELARALCQRLKQREPHNLQVRLFLFDVAVQSFQVALKNKDERGMTSGREEIQASLGEIEQVERQGALWNYGWAIYKRLEAENAPDADKKLSLLDEGLTYLARAGALRPGWSRVPLMAAEIYDRQAALAEDARTRQDKLDLAIQNYLAATRLGERNVTAIRRVVQLLNQRQRYSEADGVLRGLEEQQTPFSADLAKMAAEVYLQLDDLERALEKARRVAAESKEADDHRWAGLLLSLMSQRASADGQTSLAKEMVGEAETAFRTAIQLAEKAPENWIALVQFYGRTNQAPRAEEAIAEAQKKIPPGQAVLAVARCYEALGARVRSAGTGGKDYLAEAEKKYLAALEAAPGDPSMVRAVVEFYLRIGKYAQAEPLLERVVAGEKTVFDSAAVSMARRNLALVLTLRGDPNLDRAKRLIEENFQKGPVAPQDRRVYALVLGKYPNRRLRLEAVKIWEDLLLDPQTTGVEDQFTLAQLHLALDNWSEYTARVRSVLAAKGNEPRYLSGYVKALLEHGELSEADLWLGRLEEAASGQFPPVDLRAQFLLRRRLGQEELAARQAARKEPVSAPAVQYDTAIEVLKAFLDRKDAQPPDRLDRMLLAASKLDELGRWLNGQRKQGEAARFSSEAETLLRQYVKQAPDRPLVLARFLARRGRLDEALDLAEAAWPRQTSAPAVTDALVSLTAGGPCAAPQRRRIEALFAAALEKFHRPVPLLLAWAEFLGTQEDVQRNTQQDFERVEAAYREVLRKSPDSFLASNNLAMLLAMQKRKLDEAEQLIDRAIALAGPMAVLLDTQAAVYSAQGKPDQAMAVLAEVERERPDAVASFHQAQLHLLKREWPAAVEALRRAQKRGLTAEQLHPLEREAYRRMLETMPLAST